MLMNYSYQYLFDSTEGKTMYATFAGQALARIKGVPSGANFDSDFPAACASGVELLMRIKARMRAIAVITARTDR